MQNRYWIIRTGANLRFSGFCGISSFSYWFRVCGIWSVLYFNFYTKLHIYEFSYKFDTVYIDFSRFSGFILYPFSFFLYSAFKCNLMNYSLKVLVCGFPLVLWIRILGREGTGFSSILINSNTLSLTLLNRFKFAPCF